jgi:hypothetical protein
MVVSHVDVSSRAVVVVVVVVEMVIVVVVHWVLSGPGPAGLVSSELAVSSNPAAFGIEASHRPA